MTLWTLSGSQFQFLYDAVRKYFFSACVVIFPLEFIINAPFGRFTAKSYRWLTLDGRVTWFIMEIVSPMTFAYAFLRNPTNAQSFSTPQLVLSTCYFIHYANRAVISPLTSPPRSRSHVIVLLFAWVFNLANGFLLGSYFSLPSTKAYLTTPGYTSSTRYLVGLGLWAAGFIGNVVHDELLANIRRKAAQKGKGKEQVNGVGNGKAVANGTSKHEERHYAIPHGLLFEYISFPNYTCEWVEWFGFALAASPWPITTLPSLSSLAGLLSPSQLSTFVFSSPRTFAPLLTPPWIFLFAEIVLMYPRAYKGQQWYKEKFGDAFPKNRKIVVPFVL